MSLPARVLITPYLNNRTFVHHAAPPGARLESCVPRLAVQEMLDGGALAGVVPVGGLARLAGCVDLLGRYGIACRGASRSVLLLSREPFAALGSHTRLALSADSMSSVRLLLMLLAARPGASCLPRLVAPSARPDAELVIGDVALRRAQRTGFAHVTDLATQWFLTHGRPMVFARWVIRRDADADARRRLEAWLADYARDECALRDVTAAHDHARAGLGRSAARAYLDGIRCVLDADDLAGQAIYERELARHAWLDELLASPAQVPDATGACS
ncbi:MAG: MqnA/MqnD/SBP family protein [Gammaproteobacteria bacterium]